MSRTFPRRGGFIPSRFVSSTSGVVIFTSFMVFRRVFQHPDAGDAVSSQPENGKQKVVVPDLVSLGRQSSEEPQHKAADGLEFVLGQLHAEYFVHFSDVRPAVNYVPVRRDLVD